MINRVLVVGLLAGLLAGLLVAVMQQFATTPLILAAEVYEAPHGLQASPGDARPGDTDAGHAPSPHASSGHSHAGHTDEPAEAGEWKPADGLQRTAFTSIATIATSIGFALILLAGMLASGDEITLRTAFCWSVAAFAAAGLAPSLGLAPELPGSAAGPLLARQIWWVGTAVATGVALWLLLREHRLTAKLAGVALLIVPHVIGAPRPTTFESAAPAELAAQFAAASLLIQAALWVLSGLAAGALWEYFDRRQLAVFHADAGSR